MSETLKPCPFCGGKAYVSGPYIHAGNVFHVDCGADAKAQEECSDEDENRECYVSIGGFSTYENAIRAWNRRASEEGAAPEELICTECGFRGAGPVHPGCSFKAMRAESRVPARFTPEQREALGLVMSAASWWESDGDPNELVGRDLAGALNIVSRLLDSGASATQGETK